ncbi:MAG: methyltransferase [Saprospiraceae bacterium]|nr:methyltransferase [Saprospiraceae bacterium]
MISSKSSNTFKFKQFVIKQDNCTMKVNTDGVLLGAWADPSGASNVLDIGTGTGVIALMMAQKEPSAKITGIEIDESSSLEAMENVSNSKFADRVEIIQRSIQDYAKNNKKQFDLIISNPPFFTGGTFSANENKANVRHTIKLPHGDLLIAVNTLLHPEGNFALILPYIEGLRFIELAERSKLHLSKLTEVRHHSDKPVERLLILLQKRKENVKHEELLIMDEDLQSYTQQFISLTRDFYQIF